MDNADTTMPVSTKLGIVELNFVQCAILTALVNAHLSVDEHVRNNGIPIKRIYKELMDMSPGKTVINTMEAPEANAKLKKVLLDLPNRIAGRGEDDSKVLLMDESITKTTLPPLDVFSDAPISISICPKNENL